MKHSFAIQSKKGTKTSNLMATICSGRIIQVTQGGACIFYKEILGVCIVKSLSFSECIICEVSIQNSKGYVGVVYRFPSQDNFEFGNFLSNFENVLNNTTYCI